MATLQMGDALIAEVLTKINIICGISSDGISQPTPSAINDSNTWLCAFQHRPEAWVVCDTILYLPQASGPAKQFAAQRLCSKIQSCWSELPATSHTSLRHSVIQHIINLSVNRSVEKALNHAALSSLCIAVADIAVHDDAWTDMISDCISLFSAREETLLPLLYLLTFLPEEVENQNVLVHPHRRYSFSRLLQSTGSPLVIQFLSKFDCVQLQASRTGASTTLLITILRCFKSWVTLGGVDSNALATSPLVTAAVSGIHHAITMGDNIHGGSGDERRELLTVSVDCGCELFLQCEDVSLREPHGQQLVLTLLPLLLQLRPLLTNVVQHVNKNSGNRDGDDDDDDDGVGRGLANIFSTAGESLKELILGEAITGTMSENLLGLCDALLDVVSCRQPAIAASALYFWYCVAKRVSQSVRGKKSRPGHPDDSVSREKGNDNGGVAWMKASQIKTAPNDTLYDHMIMQSPLPGRFVTLLQILVQQCTFPMCVENNWNKEKEEDFRDWRDHLIDSMCDCVTALGEMTYISWLSQLLCHSATVGEWRALEAVMYVIRVTARRVRYLDDPALATIIQTILLLPPALLGHARIRYTATLLMGSYADWLSRHQDSLVPFLAFVTDGFQSNDFTIHAASARALMNICDACRSSLVQYLPSIIMLTTSVHQSKTPVVDQLEMWRGVGYIVTACEHSKLTETLNYVLTPLIEGLTVALNECDSLNQPTTADVILRLHNVCDWWQKITEVISSVKVPSYAPPTSERMSSHPHHSAVALTWPLVQRSCVLTNHYPTISTAVMEDVCRFFKHCMRSMRAEWFVPLLESVATFAMDGYDSTGQACFVNLARVIVDLYRDLDEDYTSSTQGKHAQSETYDRAIVRPTIINLVTRTINSTFDKYLSNGISSFTNHPDLVEDFFEYTRLLHNSLPSLFYYGTLKNEASSSACVTRVTAAAIVGLQLQHREAAKAVLYYVEALLLPHSDNKPLSVAVHQSAIIPQFGPHLTHALLCALAGAMPRVRHGLVSDILVLLLWRCVEGLWSGGHGETMTRGNVGVHLAMSWIQQCFSQPPLQHCLPDHIINAFIQDLGSFVEKWGREGGERNRSRGNNTSKDLEDDDNGGKNDNNGWLRTIDGDRGGDDDDDIDHFQKGLSNHPKSAHEICLAFADACARSSQPH